MPPPPPTKPPPSGVCSHNHQVLISQRAVRNRSWGAARSGGLQAVLVATVQNANVVVGAREPLESAHVHAGKVTTKLRVLKFWLRPLCRKREEPAGAQDEVIVLSSDSDVETSRPAQRHQVCHSCAETRPMMMFRAGIQPMHVQPERHFQQSQHTPPQSC